MGLKYGRERPIGVLSPCFADPKIGKQTNYFLLILCERVCLYQNIQRVKGCPHRMRIRYVTDMERFLPHASDLSILF